MIEWLDSLPDMYAISLGYLVGAVVVVAFYLLREWWYGRD